jgi:hypothetical protein
MTKARRSNYSHSALRFEFGILKLSSASRVPALAGACA